MCLYPNGLWVIWVYWNWLRVVECKANLHLFWCHRDYFELVLLDFTRSIVIQLTFWFDTYGQSIFKTERLIVLVRIKLFIIVIILQSAPVFVTVFVSIVSVVSIVTIFVSIFPIFIVILISVFIFIVIIIVAAPSRLGYFNDNCFAYFSFLLNLRCLTSSSICFIFSL